MKPAAPDRPRHCSRRLLAAAVQASLALAGAAAAHAADQSAPAPASSAAPPAADQKAAKNLAAVTVTGSRIRRVDMETANPVVTMDRAQIEATGKATLGDLVQELPSVNGNGSTSPAVNNGGGTGASTISLRGLGDKRTLILVNGTRLASNDVNSIPADMIERVEVLSDGASAVYGSDAIGGVVNFILRDHYNGAKITADYGESSHSDGFRRNFSVMGGRSGERGSLIVGASHHQIDAISADRRDFSKDALYLANGSVYAGGSSRTPSGYIGLPKGSALGSALGCNSVTLNPGVAGRTMPGNYHCYGNDDAYNFQPYNLDQVPQKRTNLFLLGNYKLTDHVEAYANIFYNKTESSSIIAPIPFDANADEVPISAQSYYNPFGVDFGNSRDGDSYNTFRTRLNSLGDRRYVYDTYTEQLNPGLRGSFGDSSWQWSADINYGKTRQKSQNFGFLDTQALTQALGPSYLDAATGAVTCGTPGHPIAGCTPVNIFNATDPATIAALKGMIANPTATSTYTLKQVEANANGELFDLPAGPLNLAVGLSYRKESTSTRVAPSLIGNDQGVCDVVEFCTTALSGSFNVKEAYAEALVPLLADLPFAHALNLTIGSRYSDYSSAGKSTNNKFALEWRPIEDLLLRGTVSEVFRAPNINELYQGAVNGAFTVIDPCVHYAGGHPAACANVPADGSFAGDNIAQITGITSGSVPAHYSLKPEQGKSFDFGVVYDPHWLEGMSVSADVWRINLNDLIVSTDAQTVLNQCYANAASPLCALIHRTSSGLINYLNLPTINMGKLSVKGIDTAINYRFPNTRFGRFAASLNGTYTARYDGNPNPDDPNTVTIHNAGMYTTTYGNIPRWKGLASLDWNLGPWSASWRIRYVGRTRIGSPDPSQSYSADDALPNVVRKIGAIAYNYVQLGYNFERYHTRLDIGVDNLTDRQPPLFYAGQSNNANTDVLTYDLVGRYYWARATLTF